MKNRFTKVLWLDVETLSLDPKVASVVELSYVAEVIDTSIACEKREASFFQEHISRTVHPIFHLEDQLYGQHDIHDFIESYNTRLHDADPSRLTTFGFNDDMPLFIYAKSALTFNVTPPDIKKPANWLLADNAISAKQAVVNLMAYLSALDEIAPAGKWTLAGYNVSFDYEVLKFWVKRILTSAEANSFLEKINSYVFLDTLQLARWHQYSGRLTCDQANLGSVAKELGFHNHNSHSAKDDISLCIKVTQKLFGDI